jgi:hypothetical protein
MRSLWGKLLARAREVVILSFLFFSLYDVSAVFFLAGMLIV